jgi:hypothetical protein
MRPACRGLVLLLCTKAVDGFGGLSYIRNQEGLSQDVHDELTAHLRENSKFAAVSTMPAMQEQAVRGLGSLGGA